MKLLYVTPEQLVASAQLEAALRSLQQRRLLARFVVDEARQLSSAFHMRGISCSCACQPPVPWAGDTPWSVPLQLHAACLHVHACICGKASL